MQVRTFSVKFQRKALNEFLKTVNVVGRDFYTDNNLPYVAVFYEENKTLKKDSKLIKELEDEIENN